MKQRNPILCPHIIKHIAITAFVLAASVVSAQTLQVAKMWDIPTDAGRSYVTAAGAYERGIAYNPSTGHTLLVHRPVSGTDTLQVAILDSTNGDEIGFLDITGITGGTHALGQIKVADDGVIYGSNLSTISQDFRVYRWENEQAPPELVYIGRPGGINDETGEARNGRFGDNLDVRGAGLSTQIIAGSGAEQFAALIVPDETAENPLITFKAIPLIVTGISSGDLQKGVSFGEGNTFFGKRTGSANLKHIQFTLPIGEQTSGAGTVLKNIAVNADIAGVDYYSDLKVLAGVRVSTTPSNHELMVYELAGDAANLVSTIAFPTPNKATPNAVGGVDIRNGKIFSVDGDNGVLAANVTLVEIPVAPTFVTQPSGTLSIVNGGYASLSASAIGSKPLNYQWRFNGNDIKDATNSTLSFTNVSDVAIGAYTVVVTNVAGSIESTAAMVAVTSSVLSDRATLLWSIRAGSRSWMGDANLERGIAYNSASNHVLVVTRSGPVEIHVLDPDTGDFLWTMNTDTSVVAGSNPPGFRLNMIAVADDGAVFAAGLDTGGLLYSIYKWENDSAEAVPTLIWTGNPVATAHRFGDTFDVRGAGADTQIIATTNPTEPAAQTVEPATVVIFTPNEEGTFSPTLITVPGVQAQAFRLGVAFGEGNTFWGKAPAQPLRRVSYNLQDGTAEVLNSYSNLPSLSAPIGVQASSNLLAAISFDTPDNLQLYDISDLEAGPILVDQDFFQTDNPNGNGTGSIDFGSDRLFALDTNNGIIAMKLKPASNDPQAAAAQLSATALTGGNVSFTLRGTAGKTYTIESTSDFSTWTAVKEATVGQEGTVQVSDAANSTHKFYRAVAR